MAWPSHAAAQDTARKTVEGLPDPTSTAGDAAKAPARLKTPLDAEPVLKAAASDDRFNEAQRKADEALQAKEPEKAAAPDAKPARPEIPTIDLWDLVLQGGPIMYPLGLLSVFVVALGIERALTLRRRRILPRALVRGLKSLAAEDEGLDPRQVYRLCQKYPSSAARIIRAMLLRVGRSHSEMREAVQEASQREADRLSMPVRWLTLAAQVGPMLGLLGTVQGIIIAFFRIAHLPAGALGTNRAGELASGIYAALVTTFTGLLIAIVAAVLSHLYNGRILNLFREMDEALLVLESQVLRFQRKHREEKEPDEPSTASREAEQSRAAQQTPARH